MRILGIDPGTGLMGFGVIDIDKTGKLQLVDGGVIRTSSDDDDGRRLAIISDELTEIISATKPQVMSIEKLYFAQNVTTAMSVAQARGVALLAGQQAGLEIYEYTPLQIKQAMSGYGRAGKGQVQEMVRVMLGLKTIPKPDDCADALATAITCATSVRQLKQ